MRLDYLCMLLLAALGASDVSDRERIIIEIPAETGEHVVDLGYIPQNISRVSISFAGYGEAHYRGCRACFDYPGYAGCGTTYYHAPNIVQVGAMSMAKGISVEWVQQNDGEFSITDLELNCHGDCDDVFAAGVVHFNVYCGMHPGSDWWHCLGGAPEPWWVHGWGTFSVDAGVIDMDGNIVVEIVAERFVGNEVLTWGRVKSLFR